MVAALVLAGCGEDSSPPSSPATMNIRVAMFPSGSTLPVYAGIDKGLFERNGLRIELTEGSDLPVFMAALAKGQYDVVMSGPTLVMIGAEKGLDLQIISSLQRSSRERPNAVWITRDSSIDSIAQLKGKTIAVPSLTGLIVDAAVYLLGRSGVERSDVKFIATPFPTMGDQLAAGNVDVAIATIPFFDAIAARGFRTHDDVVVEAVRDASGGAVETAMTSVWAASRTFGRDHPEMVAAWRKSLNEAIEFLDNNQSEARAMMQNWLKIPAAVLDQAPLPDWDVEITPEELVPYAVIAKAVGSTHDDPDVNALVWQGS
ncbi:MAG TPA: ABC transporter substrate-binding protein [Mycobacterium sp.]|nr:ABC transporter substrate-binding protein [Mycobacterium sp.]